MDVVEVVDMALPVVVMVVPVVVMIDRQDGVVVEYGAWEATGTKSPCQTPVFAAEDLPMFDITILLTFR